MDIRINGTILTDPRVTGLASFTDLMNDLNRMITARNEIITEVRADGREILSWDITELDMSKLRELSVSTQPARDYAIISLGDLGEYSGTVLSVLRNAEAICRKEGYAEVRQKLVEGLTYILTVIETSSKILDLKLAAARYDIRTGAQMMTELVSLKNRIAASSDFESSRKDLSELEFTLTDWLKFLELLLVRYRETQTEIGEASDITDESRHKVELLHQLHQDIKTMVDDMYAGKIAKSMDLFHKKIAILQESLAYLDRLRIHGRISYESLSVEGKNLSEKIRQITSILSEMTNAIQIGDTVLLRDLLEYEILPFIQFIRQVFEQLAANPEKG